MNELITKWKLLKKSTKALIIMGGAFLVLAGILFIVACNLAGWDLVAVFTGKTATWIYIFCGVYLFILLFIFIYFKLKER